MNRSIRVPTLSLSFAAALSATAAPPAFADIAPLGDSFAVTSAAGGGLGGFAVARDAAGDFVIVWDLNTGTSPLYAQVFGANGAARSAAFLVGTEMQGRVSSVGMDDAGNFVVAWPQASGNTLDPLQIVAQRFSVDGNALGSLVKVSGWFKEAAQTAVATNHASGDFAVSWTAVKFSGIGTNGPGGCDNMFCSWSNTTTSYARLYKSDGKPATAAFVSRAAEKQSGFGIIAFGTFVNGPNSTLDSIALDTSDRLVATFTTYLAQQNPTQQGNPIYTVNASRFDATGKAIGSAFAVSTNTPVFGAHSHVGVDDTGGFLIDWNGSPTQFDPYTPYLARYAADGSLKGGITAIPVPPSVVIGRSVFARVALADSGNYVTVWNAEEGVVDNTSIPLFPQGQPYDSAGNATGAVFSATDDDTASSSSGSAVAVDAAGEPVVVWVDFQTDSSGATTTSTLKAQRFSAP